MRVLVTGGCGFVGSALIRYLLRETGAYIINVDSSKEPYNWGTVDFYRNTRYRLINENISKRSKMDSILLTYDPHFVFHLASTEDPMNLRTDPIQFIQNNTYGTFNLIESVSKYAKANDREDIRIVLSSTDKVYGNCLSGQTPHKETSVLTPDTPHASSKASAEMMAIAWHKHHDLWVAISRGANNYGPYMPEDNFIVQCMLKMSESQEVEAETNVHQSWIYVDDYVKGLWKVANMGKGGQVYNFSDAIWSNFQVAMVVAKAMDHCVPRTRGHAELVKKVVSDVKKRYDMNSTKAYNELIWTPSRKFIFGVRQVIEWYIQVLYSGKHFPPNF